MKNHVNNLPDKTLVLAPHRLFSLWDMIEYPAVQTLNIISGCDHYEVSAGQKSEPDQFPGEKELAEIREFVEGIRRLAAQLNLETLKSRALLFLNNIFKAQTHRGPLHWAVVKNEMSSMRSTFVARLCAQKFAFIPADKAKYFEQEDAFGEVGKPFKPLASDEITPKSKPQATAWPLISTPLRYSMQYARQKWGCAALLLV